MGFRPLRITARLTGNHHVVSLALQIMNEFPLADRCFRWACTNWLMKCPSLLFTFVRICTCFWLRFTSIILYRRMCLSTLYRHLYTETSLEGCRGKWRGLSWLHRAWGEALNARVDEIILESIVTRKDRALLSASQDSQPSVGAANSWWRSPASRRAPIDGRTLRYPASPLDTPPTANTFRFSFPRTPKGTLTRVFPGSPLILISVLHRE